MTIWVQTKTAGARRVLSKQPYLLPDGTSSLRQLLEVVVGQEAARYNNKETDGALCRFLTQQELDENARTGRVSFGRRYTDRKADITQAMAVAIQAVEDGLVKVMRNGSTLEDLDAPLQLTEGDTVTFLRLIFLTGTYW